MQAQVIYVCLSYRLLPVVVIGKWRLRPCPPRRPKLGTAVTRKPSEKHETNLVKPVVESVDAVEDGREQEVQQGPQLREVVLRR